MFLGSEGFLSGATVGLSCTGVGVGIEAIVWYDKADVGLGS